MTLESRLVTLFNWKSNLRTVVNREVGMETTIGERFPRGMNNFCKKNSAHSRKNIRFQGKNAKIPKNPIFWWILWFLVSSWTATIRFHLEIIYFLEWAKFILQKLFIALEKRSPMVVGMPTSRFYFVPRLRFSMKTWHIAKNDENSIFWLDLYRKSFDSHRNILQTQWIDLCVYVYSDDVDDAAVFLVHK